MSTFGSHAATQTRNHPGGIQHTFRFRNGFGASVVRNNYSYGNEASKWELAVLDGDDLLTYETPITDGVLGWLDEAEVAETLDAIAALPNWERS